MSDEQFQAFHPKQYLILQDQGEEGVRGLAPRDAGAKLGQGGLDLKKGTYDHDIN